MDSTRVGTSMLLPPHTQEIALDDGIVWHPLCGVHKLPDSGAAKVGGGNPVKPRGDFLPCWWSGYPES